MTAEPMKPATPDTVNTTHDTVRATQDTVSATSAPASAAAAPASADWERRTAAAWARLDELDEAQFRDLIDELVAELPPDSAIGPFEQACAFDSTGHSDKAVPLYREALERGLPGLRRRRAKIQLSSSLRNTGRPEDGVRLLTPELDAEPDELDDAVRAVLALCLADLGREREGLALVLGALAPHLPRYQRSMANYARLLVEPESAA